MKFHTNHRECTLSECDAAKDAWLIDVQKRFPIGCRVRVADADLDEYVGAIGIVRDYDTGYDGAYPYISVKF